MKDWEIARNSDIDQTPRSYKAGQAGERLFLFELGTTAATLAGYSADEIDDAVLEEIGRTIDPHITENDVPSLLQVKYNLADDNETPDDISLRTANEHRNQLLVETVNKEKREEIVTQVIEEF